MIFIIILWWIYFFALHWVIIFLYLEWKESEDETLSYIDKIEQNKTRAIEFAKIKFNDDKENKELIEVMKEIWRENRPALKLGKKFIN